MAARRGLHLLVFPLLAALLVRAGVPHSRRVPCFCVGPAPFGGDEGTPESQGGRSEPSSSLSPELLKFVVSSQALAD
jgi:hypothetical protein